MNSKVKILLTALATTITVCLIKKPKIGPCSQEREAKLDKQNDN